MGLPFRSIYDGVFAARLGGRRNRDETFNHREPSEAHSPWLSIRRSLLLDLTLPFYRALHVIAVAGNRAR